MVSLTARAALGALAFVTATAHAALTVSVEPTAVTFDKPVMLVVRAVTDRDPDFAAVERDFHVANVVRQSNAVTLDGAIVQTRTWRLTLAPRRVGVAQVPPLRIGNERSEPVAVTVAPAAGGAKPVFLEAMLERGPLHLRQQVLMTLRLFIAPDVMAYSMGVPAAEAAVIETLDEGGLSYAVREGTRYKVHESRFAVFPLRAGRLRVAPPLFRGGISVKRGPQMPFGGHLPQGGIRPLFATAPELEADVLAAPVAGAWLPASSVSLSGRVAPERGPYRAEEPLTWTVELQVAGQTHTQIEPPRPAFAEGVKVYADPPMAMTLREEHGVSARQTLRWTLVPTREGDLVLPEVTLPWWDVAAGAARVATLPARTLSIGAAAAAVVRAPVSAAPAATAAEPPHLPEWRRVGPWLAVALLAMALVAALARRVRRPETARGRGVAALRRELRRRLSEGPPAAARGAVLAWAQARFADPFLTMSTLVALAPAPLRHELERLDRAAYGRGGEWNRSALVRALDQALDAPASTFTGDALPALWPRSPTPPDDHLAQTRRRRRSRRGVAVAAAGVAVGLALWQAAPRQVSADAYRALVAQQAAQVLPFLRAVEQMQEQIHPETAARQQAELAARFGGLFARLRAERRAATPPAELAEMASRWGAALTALEQSLEVFRDAPPTRLVETFFHSRRAFTQGVAALYAMRDQLPELRAYWVLPEALPAYERLEARAAPDVDVGLVQRPLEGQGGYALYVPENYDPARRWPLIVALHGSQGEALSTVLTWLRAAKSHGYLVLAPKSLADTWMIEDPVLEMHLIGRMLDDVRARYSIDPRRVFLSGLSDGGTFTYILGLSCPALWAGIAPIAAVLPPALDRRQATDLPVLITHGRRDFVFPVQAARESFRALVESGYPYVSYEELPDWGHALPYRIHERHVLPWLSGIDVTRPRRPERGGCPIAPPG